MNSQKYIGSSSFYRGALAIAIPVMLQTLLQNMVSLVDSFMVAGLGDVKMSGVNVANQLIFVFFVALMTITSAGGIFMSQFNGAKDTEGMQQTFRFKMHVALILAIAVSLISAIFPRQLLGLLVNTNSASKEIVDEGTKFLTIVLFTFIPIVISTVIGSSLREIGKVKPPLVISLSATILNTFFNWVLIYGNLGAPRLEVEGSAIATIIARSAEMIAYIAYIKITKPAFYVRFTKILAVNLRIFVTILRKSGIIFLTDMSWVLTETVMTAVYNGRGGAEIVSGMAAGWTIANLFFLVFGAIHTSTGVIVGGTLGRNELDLARQQARWLRTGAFILGIAVAALEFVSVILVPVVFGNLSPGSRLVTRDLLWVIACYMPIWTYLNAQFATARAGGDAIMGVWVDAGVNVLFFLPGIFALAILTPLGPIGIYAVVKTTDFLKVGIAHWQLRKERWVRNLTTGHMDIEE